jgi:methyl-accepting chemotaxis protein WspA
MKDLSVKKKLYLGFGSIVAIILILLAVAYNNFARLTEANGWDKHTMQVLIEIDRINNAVLRTQVEIRGYLLTGNDTVLASEREYAQEVSQHMQNAIQLTADNPRQNERLKKAGSLLDTWLNVNLKRQIDKRRALGDVKGAADALGQSNELRDSSAAGPRVRALLEDATA